MSENKKAALCVVAYLVALCVAGEMDYQDAVASEQEAHAFTRALAGCQNHSYARYVAGE